MLSLAESPHAPTPPVTRRAPGAGSRVTAQERQHIQRLRITESLSISQIARRTGRTREAIGHACQGDDFDALQKQFDTECRQIARRRLAGGITQAAEAWVEAVTIASIKGDHRPAKELLLHTDTIQPLGEGDGGPRVVVQIGVNAGDVKVGIQTIARGTLEP